MINIFKNKLVLAGIAVALVGGGAVAATRATSGPKAVQTLAVAPQALEDSFFEDGLVRAQSRHVVSLDVGGKVLTLTAAEGQTVKQGDALLTLDDAALTSQRAVLAAEKDATLASWAQSREQTQQQVAAIQAQRAGYSSANIDGALKDQIAALTMSIDPGVGDSVAYTYERVMEMTDTRTRYLDEQLWNAQRVTPAAVQTLEGQLEAAMVQSASIENQQRQYSQQTQASLLDLQAKAAGAADQATKQLYQDMISNLNSSGVSGSFSQMQSVTALQISRLQRDLEQARSQTPQEVDAVRAQQLALESERRSLEEQYSQYVLTTRNQILALESQRKQAAKARSTEAQVRGKLDDQIKLLQESAADGSGTASYYNAQIAQLDSNIAEIDRQLSHARVAAPIGGIIGAVDIHPGETLPTGARVTEIIDPSTLAVECMLLTDDADTVAPGAQVQVVWERRGGDVTYPGVVSAISPVAVNSVSAVGLNEQRVKLTIAPTFTGDVIPRDGYQVRVRFSASQSDMLAVPTTAIVKTDRGDAVYLVRDGHAALVPVTLGVESGSSTVILSGIQPGDVIVARPETDGVADGQAVK